MESESGERTWGHRRDVVSPQTSQPLCLHPLLPLPWPPGPPFLSPQPLHPSAPPGTPSSPPTFLPPAPAPPPSLLCPQDPLQPPTSFPLPPGPLPASYLHLPSPCTPLHALHSPAPLYPQDPLQPSVSISTAPYTPQDPPSTACIPPPPQKTSPQAYLHRRDPGLPADHHGAPLQRGHAGVLHPGPAGHQVGDIQEPVGAGQVGEVTATVERVGYEMCQDPHRRPLVLGAAAPRPPLSLLPGLLRLRRGAGDGRDTGVTSPEGLSGAVGARGGGGDVSRARGGSAGQGCTAPRGSAGQGHVSRARGGSAGQGHVSRAWRGSAPALPPRSPLWQGTVAGVVPLPPRALSSPLGAAGQAPAPHLLQRRVSQLDAQGQQRCPDGEAQRSVQAPGPEVHPGTPGTPAFLAPHEHRIAGIRDLDGGARRGAGRAGSPRPRLGGASGGRTPGPPLTCSTCLSADSQPSGSVSSVTPPPASTATSFTGTVRGTPVSGAVFRISSSYGAEQG